MSFAVEGMEVWKPPSPPAGYWVHGAGTPYVYKLPAARAPNVLRRFAMWACFNFRWEAVNGVEGLKR